MGSIKITHYTTSYYRVSNDIGIINIKKEKKSQTFGDTAIENVISLLALKEEVAEEANKYVKLQIRLDP